MSKRAQESKTEEGPPVAKPRPMSLVSRNFLTAKKTSSIDSGASDSPGNQKVGSESCFKRHREIGGRQQPRSDSTFSRVATS